MRRHHALAILPLLLFATPSQAEITPRGNVKINGAIIEGKDVSAIERLSSDHYILGVDEGRSLQLIEDCQPGPCQAGPRIPLLSGRGDEVDVEAMARDARFLYVVGSHTCNRRTVKKRNTRAENLERLSEVLCQESRDGLFRLPLDATSGLPKATVEQKDLRLRIHHDPILSAFDHLPSKENGIDIEGLAIADGKLFIGFRGPVLRGNWVPVMVASFDDLTHHELRWLRLGGRGIRSLAAVDGGFLVLAGAVGDAKMTYELYFWDGEDCLSDEGSSPCRLQELGEVPSPDGDKPEGMTLLQDGGTAVGWDILVVYDSAAKGSPKRFRVRP